MASLGRGDEQCEKFDSLESQEEFLLETKLVVLSYLSLVPPHVCADSRKGESSSCTTHSDESDVSPRQQSSHPSPRVIFRVSGGNGRGVPIAHAVSKLVKCSTFKDSNTETHASHLDSLDLLVHNLSDNITEVDEIDAGVDTSQANGNFENVKVYEAKSCPDLSNNKHAGNSTKLSVQSDSDEFHHRKNSTPSDDMQRLSSAAKKLHRQSSLPSSKVSRKQTSSSADLLRRSSLAQSSSGHNVCYEDGVTDSLDHASQSTDIALDDEEDESHDSMSSLEDDEKENTPDVSPIDESKKQNNHMQDSGAANSHDNQDSFLPCPRVPSRDMYLQLPGPIARPHDRESSAVLLGEEISEELHSIEQEIIRARSAGLHMNLSPVLTPMTPQTEVAMRIANIGDSVCYLYHERFEQLEEQLMGITGESLTYERFREVISSFLGEQGGGLRWVALLLDFTQHVAVHLRQKGERGVSKLVNFTAKFIADRTAAFILQNGGWAAIAHWDSGSSASNSLFSSPRSSAPVTPYQEITENPLGQLQAQQRDSHLNSATYLDTGTEKKETEEELTNMENPIQLNDCDANGSNTLSHDKPLQDEDVPSKESSPDTEPNTSYDCACDTSDCNTQQGHWLPYLAVGFLAVGLGIVFALKR